MGVEEKNLRTNHERPDSPVITSGVDHITLQGSSEEDTVAFYRDLLGMPLVIRQPHLGKPELTHLFFDTGDGRFLSVFVSDDRETRSNRSLDSSFNTDVGTVQHIAFQLECDQLSNLREMLDDIGHHCELYESGFTFSLYTRDPNGFRLEFNIDKFIFPMKRRAEVAAVAQRKRVEDGAEYIKDEHMVATLEELDIEWERQEVPDAPMRRDRDI